MGENLNLKTLKGTLHLKFRISKGIQNLHLRILHLQDLISEEDHKLKTFLPEIISGVNQLFQNLILMTLLLRDQISEQDLPLQFHNHQNHSNLKDKALEVLEDKGYK